MFNHIYCIDVYYSNVTKISNSDFFIPNIKLTEKFTSYVLRENYNSTKSQKTLYEDHKHHAIII